MKLFINTGGLGFSEFEEWFGRPIGGLPAKVRGWYFGGSLYTAVRR